MQTCNACGFDNAEGHDFCGSCGSRLGPSAPGRCGECGNGVGLRDKFCMYCGAALPEVGGRWDPAKLAAAARGGGAENATAPPSDPFGEPPTEPRVGSATDTVVPGDQVLDLAGDEVDEESTGETPTAAMRAPVRLKVTAGRELDEAFILPPDGGVVGRNEDADVCLEGDFYVDDQHAHVGRDATGVYIEDLESVNGTFIRVKGRHHLRSGDEVKIGQSIFRVEK